MGLYRKHIRFALSLLAAALVCVASRSALAAAPQCDVRAAITFAPNPTLESSKASSIEATADDCSAKPVVDRMIQRGRAPSTPDASDAAPRAAVPAALRVLPATPTAALAHFAETFTLPAGIRARVERPPRG